MYINLIEILLHNNGTILLVDKNMPLDKRGAVYLFNKNAVLQNYEYAYCSLTYKQTGNKYGL